MITKYSIQMLFGIGLILASNALAEPPMVQKHLFSPSPDVEQRRIPSPTAFEQEKPAIDPKLKQEILFTGVIIGPKGKIALCRETKDKNIRLMKREGDSILGLTVKRIEPNYMLLADADGKEMRFNLYQPDRKRPDSPPAPQPLQQTQMMPPAATGPQQFAMPQTGEVSSAPKAGGLSSPSNVLTGVAVQPQSQLDANVKPMSETEKQNAQRISAFKQAIEQAKQNHAAGVVSQTEPSSNPFQHAIQKAPRP